MPPPPEAPPRTLDDKPKPPSHQRASTTITRPAPRCFASTSARPPANRLQPAKHASLPEHTTRNPTTTHPRPTNRRPRLARMRRSSHRTTRATEPVPTRIQRRQRPCPCAYGRSSNIPLPPGLRRSAVLVAQLDNLAQPAAPRRRVLCRGGDGRRVFRGRAGPRARIPHAAKDAGIEGEEADKGR